jgi:cellulose biosynthesis protein BcsQ
MKIALIAGKGGVGKSSISILLHEAIRQTGQTSAIRDLDNIQGSASKALERFGGTREKPGETYDVLLIDTPPSLASPSTASAVTAAEIILVPTSPSPVDVWEAEKSVQFARTKNPRALVRIVLNRTRTGTLLTGAVAESLKGTSAPVLPVTIAERQCYQHALLGGWAALDPKAEKEVLQFTVAVTSLR